MNAITYSDRTSYVAYIVFEDDFYNLLTLYFDFIFNPLLSKDIFDKECSRFIYGEKHGGIIYNGLVREPLKR